MSYSKRVLSPKNGDVGSSVMFVAEAPGRFGAEITGVPLCGDRTGDRFEELLRAMNWSRSTVFVTNAVLCNPRNGQGNNDVPTAKEVKQCSGFLRRTIDVVNPLLVIALGRVALAALSLIEPHQFELRKFRGKVVEWNGRHLGILYHPGPRTQVHRKWQEQLQDAKAVARFAAGTLGIMPSPPQAEELFRNAKNGMKLSRD
jgi:uracil-DNA glycosylase family 4